MLGSGRAIEDYSDDDSVVDLVVGPRLRSLEGLTVNRVWPIPRRRLIGPFIFLDHMQPVALPAGTGLDVPPHPHIGLATVTYLFEGELMHADSLGVRQPIRPGDLNWMTAGRGITHSERTTDADRGRDSRIHGLQAWVALPTEIEAVGPTFEHVAAGELPALEVDAASLRLIAGSAFGRTAPVVTASPLFYLDASLPRGGKLNLPAALGQRGIYLVSGEIAIDGRAFSPGRIVVLRDERDCTIRASEDARFLLLGGARLEGERHIWWNFVASDPVDIEAAKADWAEGRFPPVPGDEERMSIPAG